MKIFTYFVVIISATRTRMIGMGAYSGEAKEL